jgi:hypothetical protein
LNGTVEWKHTCSAVVDDVNGNVAVTVRRSVGAKPVSVRFATGRTVPETFGHANDPEAILRCNVPVPDAGFPVTVTVSPGAVAVAEAEKFVAHVCAPVQLALTPGGNVKTSEPTSVNVYVDNGFVVQAPAGPATATVAADVAPAKRPAVTVVVNVPVDVFPFRKIEPDEVCPVFQVITKVPVDGVSAPATSVLQFPEPVAVAVEANVPPVTPKPTQPPTVAVDVVVVTTIVGSPRTGSGGDTVLVPLRVAHDAWAAPAGDATNPIGSTNAASMATVLIRKLTPIGHRVLNVTVTLPLPEGDPHDAHPWRSRWSPTSTAGTCR